MTFSSTYIARQPTFEAHLLTEDEDVDTLNQWVASMFSPRYSAETPAFNLDSDGVPHIVETGEALRPGCYLVVTQYGGISQSDPGSFENGFEPK